MEGGEYHREADTSRDVLQSEVDVLKAMAEPTRLAVLKTLLRLGELSVTEICETIDFDMSGISHHLSTLKSARLVTVRREGKFLFYSVTDKERMGRMLELLGEQVHGNAETPARHGAPDPAPAYGTPGPTTYPDWGRHTASRP